MRKSRKSTGHIPADSQHKIPVSPPAPPAPNSVSEISPKPLLLGCRAQIREGGKDRHRHLLSQNEQQENGRDHGQEKIKHQPDGDLAAWGIIRGHDHLVLVQF